MSRFYAFVPAITNNDRARNFLSSFFEVGGHRRNFGKRTDAVNFRTHNADRQRQQSKILLVALAIMAYIDAVTTLFGGVKERQFLFEAVDEVLTNRH